MSRRGLAADSPHHLSDRGVIQRASSGPFMVSAGPDGCMKELMYVCAQVGAVTLVCSLNMSLSLSTAPFCNTSPATLSPD
jgi:hypothetical protein